MNYRNVWNNCQKMASALDKVYPGWHMDMSLLQLDVGDPDNCVYHQLIMQGLGTNAAKKLSGLNFHDKEEDVLAICNVRDKAFCSKLTEYWKSLIKKRRNR